MTQTDDRILEFYEDTEIGAPPSVVAWNIGISDTHVKRRISELTASGLLERVDKDRGYYQITDLGRDYLAGDLDADELERDE